MLLNIHGVHALTSHSHQHKCYAQFMSGVVIQKSWGKLNVKFKICRANPNAWALFIFFTHSQRPNKNRLYLEIVRILSFLISLRFNYTLLRTIVKNTREMDACHILIALKLSTIDTFQWELFTYLSSSIIHSHMRNRYIHLRSIVHLRKFV